MIVLHKLFNAYESKHQIDEAMQYVLLQSGKRLRPTLMRLMMDDLAVPSDQGVALQRALEMVHTYSLVHDDLPAMDDDDLRRGLPTVHKAFDEATAILTGDALLTEAFLEIASAFDLSDTQKVLAVQSLARASGKEGMIYGQVLDIEDAIETQTQLEQCYILKTGMLFICALQLACIAAQREDLNEWAFMVGSNMGLAFQFQDDILEITQAENVLGKSSASDMQRGKTTIVSLLGLEAAQLELASIFEALELETAAFPSVNQFINHIKTRTY